MATPRQIRGRIRVAKNIQQITKAMKMVAAARLRRAQESVASARPYAEKMREVMQSLGGNAGGSVQHPLLRQGEGEPKNVGVILITGDRGLCGAYNSNVIRRTLEAVRPFGTGRTRLICIGKKGATFFRRREYPIVAEFPAPLPGVTFATAQNLAKTARDLFESGEIDVLYLIYTQFFSAMTQRPRTIQILPLEPPQEDTTPAVAGSKADYIFEPGPEQILGSLLPRYVDTQVYQAMIESMASFFGAQMTSMSSATDNAGKMISTLTLSLNRARQATITKEIAEIVGGAEALK